MTTSTKTLVVSAEFGAAYACTAPLAVRLADLRVALTRGRSSMLLCIRSRSAYVSSFSMLTLLILPCSRLLTFG
jgi:hypothetical protein